ncbi:ABC transporter permease [Actinorugispora endophytica]|uniref:ABC-2 type transport system permease protein n=1 Tax=Actinorugispora endophytica TaxID=1605990 RepID=A0A4V3D8T3_9ACTN|nr:ABC transporter permease [Actinorugispora endophytica]TDQ53031.1 hypothetical protein EV190_105149 [Actinorugispora endophytica]
MVATNPTGTARRRGGGLPGAMAAEWTKLWTVRSTWWCLLGGAALMVGSAVVFGTARATNNHNAGVTDLVIGAGEPAVSGAQLAQFAVVALAMTVVTGEYASGQIRATLQATPLRGGVLLAKAAVLAPVLLVFGALIALFGAAATYPFIRDPRFGGYGVFDPVETAVDALGVGCYLALLGLLVIGVAFVLRSGAGTLTIVFLLLLGLPLMLVMTGNEVLLEIGLRTPQMAGLAFMESRDNMTGGPMPYGPGEGFLLLVGWAGTALATGYAALRFRDA